MNTPPPYNPNDRYSNGYAGLNNAVIATSSSALKRVYLKMTLGLIVTALISMWAASSQAYLQFIMQNPWSIWALLIVEIGLVIAISAGINKFSSGVCTALFYGYAAINGLALSPIFLVYTATSIAKAFFISAGMFAGMSVYGAFTNKDLSKFGNFLFMALIGLIIASVVNIFTHSSKLDWLLSIAGILIFVGLTAVDTQKIKQMAENMPEEHVSRLATIGALTLYLDFINLFLYLLRFLGNSRN